MDTVNEKYIPRYPIFQMDTYLDSPEVDDQWLNSVLNHNRFTFREGNIVKNIFPFMPIGVSFKWNNKYPKKVVSFLLEFWGYGDQPGIR